MLARRTSPTNMGLALLANLSAYDFGYVPAGQLLERTRDAFATMHQLERYRGHFYNWYDTQTLQPLLPMYVSTVDSGNLAGHLLTLRPGLAALPDQPILAARWLEGLDDTPAGAARRPRRSAIADPLRGFRQELDAALAEPPATLAAGAAGSRPAGGARGAGRGRRGRRTPARKPTTGRARSTGSAGRWPMS